MSRLPYFRAFTQGWVFVWLIIVLTSAFTGMGVPLFISAVLMLAMPAIYYLAKE